MKKTLSCILSFIPTVTVLTCIVILIIITGLINGGIADGVFITVLQTCTLIVEILGFILGVVLLVIYIIKTIINRNLTVGMKILWCALLFYLSVFFFAILPVYWFVVLRKEQS